VSSTYSREVAAAFDAVAEEYEQHYSTRGDLADTHHIANRARDLYAPVAPGTFVDLGCGPGTMLPWLMLPANQYLGADISEAMIEQARWRFGHLGYRFHVADECWLERRDVTFILGAFGPLQHAYHLGEFANSIRKALRPGGRFLLMGRARQARTRVLGSDALTRPYSAAQVRSAFGGWTNWLDITPHRTLTPRWLPYSLQRTALFWEDKLNLDPDGGEWLVVEGER
jgi:SAM-dependent methyltransferase